MSICAAAEHPEIGSNSKQIESTKRHRWGGFSHGRPLPSRICVHLPDSAGR